MGIYALEFMHFFNEKVLSGQFCIVKYYIFSLFRFPEELASKSKFSFIIVVLS